MTAKGDQRSPINLPTSLTETSIGCGVTVDANGNAVLPSAGSAILGILYGLGGTGSSAVIRTAADGALLAQYGGTVTLPAVLKCNASGQFVAASASDIAAGQAVAIALDGGSSGELHAVVLIGGASAASQVTGTETITSGAASLATMDTLLSTTATVAYTLANGLFAGQQKRFREITAASSPLGTLTIATPFGTESATHVFTGTGQELVLEWTGAAWHMIDKKRAGTETVTVGTTVLTGHDMCLVYSLAVTGTVHSNSGSLAIPAPTLPGEVMFVRTGSAGSLPNGDINIAGFTKAEVAATSLAGINATTCTAQFIGAPDGWHNVNVTTATYS